MLDCDEFYALDHTQVYDLIASDTITVPSEEKVYESVISWVSERISMILPFKYAQRASFDLRFLKLPSLFF